MIGRKTIYRTSACLLLLASSCGDIKNSELFHYERSSASRSHSAEAAELNREQEDDALQKFLEEVEFVIHPKQDELLLALDGLRFVIDLSNPVAAKEVVLEGGTRIQVKNWTTGMLQQQSRPPEENIRDKATVDEIVDLISRISSAFASDDVMESILSGQHPMAAKLNVEKLDEKHVAITLVKGVLPRYIVQPAPSASLVQGTAQTEPPSMLAELTRRVAQEPHGSYLPSPSAEPSSTPTPTPSSTPFPEISSSPVPSP